MIACKCEAAIERELSPDETPDGRPGVSCLLFTMDTESLGKRLVDSILTRDYQVAQGLTILLAAVVVVSTLIASFLYRAADPRVRDE